MRQVFPNPARAGSADPTGPPWSAEQSAQEAMAGGENAGEEVGGVNAGGRGEVEERETGAILRRTSLPELSLINIISQTILQS